MKPKLSTGGDIVIVEMNPLHVHLCSEADLRASLAAIHYNASRPLAGDKVAILCQMASIRDECERCIPSLKGLRP